MTDQALRARGRIAGAFYLVYILGCMFAQPYVRFMLVAKGATAANIAAHQPLFRLGLGVEAVSVLSFAIAGLLLYELLRPVNRTLSLFAAALAVGEACVHGTNLLLQYAPAVLLGSDPGGAFQALAYGAFTLGGIGFSVYLIFFGVWLFLIGVLAARSGVLSRLLGWVLVVAGLSTLASGLLPHLAPAAGKALFMFLLVPFAIGRLWLAIWLLAFGVNADKRRALET